MDQSPIAESNRGAEIGAGSSEGPVDGKVAITAPCRQGRGRVGFHQFAVRAPQAMNGYLPETLVKVLLTMVFVQGVATGPNGTTCVKGVNNQGCKK